MCKIHICLSIFVLYKVVKHIFHTGLYVHINTVLGVLVAGYQRDHMIFVLWGSAYFTKHRECQLTPFCCKWWHFIPWISWWAFGLFPCLHHFALCCYNHRVSGNSFKCRFIAFGSVPRRGRPGSIFNCGGKISILTFIVVLLVYVPTNGLFFFFSWKLYCLLNFAAQLLHHCIKYHQQAAYYKMMVVVSFIWHCTSKKNCSLFPVGSNEMSLHFNPKEQVILCKASDNNAILNYLYT